MFNLFPMKKNDAIKKGWTFKTISSTLYSATIEIVDSKLKTTTIISLSGNSQKLLMAKVAKISKDHGL